MTTPPFCFTALRMSSGTLRGDGQRAKALEWLAMTGAAETRKASAIVAGETCEMSTSMPSRFISLTTRSPKGVRAVVLGVSVAASAQSSVVLWVKRHVARAEYVECTELGEAVLDRDAPLDPDQRRDLARRGRCARRRRLCTPSRSASG